jgi:FHS family glucose/mannose:H+ symporter-like MFS transporter
MTPRGAEGAAFGGMFLFGIVVALLGAVVPLVSAPLGLGLDAVGNLFVALNGAVLAGSLAFGLLVDRFGYRGALVGGPLLAGLALVLVAGAETPVALAGAVALLGLGGSALNSTTNILVADLHPEPKAKAAALNRLGAFFGVGALFLPFLIATLLDRLGLSPILLGAAGLCLVGAVFSAVPSYPPAKQPDGLSVGEALALLRHPLVAVLGALLFFQAGTEMLLCGYLTTFLTQETGVGVRAASGVLAAYWTALIAARALIGRVLMRVPALSLVPPMAAGAAVALVLATFAPGFSSAAVLLLLAAFALAGIVPTILGVAGAAVPKRTGAVFGLLFSPAVIGAMALPWLGGHLAAAFGVRVVLVLSAAGFAMVVGLALWAQRLSRTR